jgi:hypothetical protein
MEGCSAAIVSSRRLAATLLAAAALVLALASIAAAAKLPGSSEPGWGPAGLGSTAHAARAAAAHGSRGARAAARPDASPAIGETGSIKGKVTDAVTTAGIEGIEVCAWPLEPGEEEAGFPECTLSAAGGAYKLPALPVGKYAVEFTTPFNSTLDYVLQYYDDESSFEEATPVTVTGGAAPTASAAMVKGGRVSGKVTAVPGGGPIEGIEVCVWSAAPGNESFGCSETNTSGEYLATGLAPGGYKVGFRSPPESHLNYVTQYYSGESSFLAGDEISVAKEVTTENINAALRSAGLPPENTVRPTISGQIAVGSTVTCSPGAWSGTSPITFSYQWKRDLAPIEGATSTSYTIQSADVGHILWCEVIATNGAGQSWYRVGYRVPAPLIPPPTMTTATTTGPPAGGVQPVRIVVPSLAIMGRLHVTGAKGSVRLHCALGPCHGTVQLLGSVTRRVTVHGRKVTRHVTIVLGTGSFSLLQGATGKVTVHLNAAGRRLLAGAARHPRSEKLKLTLQGAATSVRAVTVD